MFMLNARSRVVDVPGVVWALTRLLFIVAVMLALLVSAGVAYAQGTPTAPTIESVAVTSDPGEDGGYAIGDEIQVGLTFSEAVTVTGTPQLTLDVGGRNRTSEYSEGSTTTQLLFTYTVLSGDEDTDGIAVVANSLALNGGAIRAGSTNATLTHADLQAEDHKVDGIAPTVTVGGETRIYVPPGRQFNVVFYFSEKVYGITTAEITVTNGQAHDVQATGVNDTWPKYTRWDVIIQPATEGPVTVTLEAGAGADAYGNGNTAPDSALEVIAANPVTVEVARTTSGFAEGGRAEFTVTRSRDNGAISVFLSLDQTGDLLSGSVEVYPPADPNNPSEPVTPQEFTFTETPFNLNVTFAAGETSKRIAVPTEDDYRDEEDGTVTLSVPARTDQYKYIPGHASSATADVRDNDVPVTVSLYWIRSFHPYTHSNLDTALEGGSISLVVYGRATGQPLQVTLAVTEVGSYLDLDGDGAWGYENLGNGKLLVTLPVDLSFQNVVIPLVENDVREADGSVTITIEPDPERSYTPSVQFDELTVPVKDNDTPSTVSISAPDSITEGGPLSYTLTRTWAPGQSQGELSVNVELAQTGDYITWPTAHQPDADGLVTIPVNFAARSLTATLTLETVDDQMSEDSGSVTATILADADGRYVTGADSAHTTKLLDNDLPIISVAAVSAELTEGTDAQFRFSRAGNTSGATRVGLWVGGLPKIMTDATEAIALTADNADLSQRLHIHGAWVDYILEFAAGEAEKTLSFTTEADNVNEGDGWFGVTIVQRAGNPFGIGTGYAQVLVKDDDIPTVSLTRPVGPTGLTLSADGTTWEGQIGEKTEFSYSSVCTGVTEFSEDQGTNLRPLGMWVMYANHPAHYGEGRQDRLGLNFANIRGVGAQNCAGDTVTAGTNQLYVGPENGVLEIELLPVSELVARPSPPNTLHLKVFLEFIKKYEEAARTAEAAGTLITQKDIIHPRRLGFVHRSHYCAETDLRYCPKYLVGTVNKIRLTIINRDPTILIKAENSQVEEGQPARFVVERLWSKDVIGNPAPDSTTVVSLRASQNGQYITGALPTEITFGLNETRKVIELQTVGDGAFGDDGSVTIELLPDTTGAGVNLQGKYTTWEIWQGHTPEGGRSDRATVAITNNDTKPGITIAPASALEGDSGSADMTFTVTLAKAVAEAVTVNYATSDGTAIAGRDYTAVSNGSVTIAAGATTAEFTVPVTGDETDELDETFNVTISMPDPEPNLNGGSSGEPMAAIIGGDTATVTGTIRDDDPAVVTVAPKKSPVTEGEEVVFVLTRTGVTDEELYMLVDVEDPARRRLMIAKFDADAVTTELSVATENNDLVDYPSERDYTIHLYGDGYFGDRDDERYTPGDPDEATVTVQDNDALVVVTVEPVKEVVGAGESVQFRFRRTGSIAGALTISFQGFEHPSSGDATLADASVTFLADNDTVVYTNDVTSSGTVNPISRAHTVLIYGDAGRGGIHRSWIAGNPNRATVVVAVDALGPMPVTASYPGRVAAAETVSVEYTVTNLGTRALLGYENRVSDGTRISTTPDRGNCDIRDEIPAGESRTCSASFTVTNQDVTNGKIEFNATARNLHKSSTLRVYIRVAQPVEFGFATADNLEVTEGPNVTAILPVTRTGRLNEAVTVTYQLRPHGTRPATLGEDFTDPSSTPGLLTFPANVTSANIVINITQDQIDEERERFRVVLVPLADGTITEGKESRVVLVKDEHQENDPYRPTASLQLVSSGPVPENEGPVEFAIVLDRVWGREGRYEVEVLLDQSTATPGFAALGKEGDFEEPLIRILRIPAGQTRFEFSVPLYDDDVREEDETFLLHLTSPYDDSFRTIGASNRALATIADDDRVPPTEVALSLSHNGSALESAPEGSTQQDITVTATFPQIRWPGDASNAPLRPADPRDVDTTVRVQVDPNSGATHAAGPDDFAPLKVEDDQGDFLEIESFDIVIPAGQTSGTVTLRFRPVNDDVDEEDETVTLLGSELVAGDSAGSLPVRSASFTIIDDDTRGITVSPSSALIGLSLVEGGEPGTYSLVLDSQPTDTVVITLAGNQGGFLRLVPDTLTFTSSDWATPQTVSVVALDDGIAGGAGPLDIINHQVSGGDYGNVTAPDILTIIEDTTRAFVYLEGGQASESDGHVEFTVTVRPILRTTPVLVRYATVDGTAIAGSDYTREVETGQTYKILNIPAGQSSATIRIPIIDNQVYESADETFTLQLTNHNNKATLDGDATSLTATGAIADDDPTPVVSVAGPAGEVSYVSENAKDPVTFTLTLVGQSAGDVTVDYATGEAGLLDLFTARQGLAGATENEDYAGTSGTVTFTSGQTTKTVTVQVTDDDVSEDTEFFGFRINSPQGADLRGQRSEDVADVGLVDDDARGVTINPTSISLHEPASGETAVAGAYTVNLNSKPTDTVTVTIGGGDPAVSLSGDTLTNNQLTFTTTNWNMAQTITVTPVKDDNAAGETVTLTHTVSGGDYAGIAADSVTVNLTDSDTRNLVLSEESIAVTEGDATGVGYTVKLATQPSDTVTVAISGHDGADLTLSGTTLTNNQLTFTTTNWGTAQTVTVKAGDDDNAVDESETLAHTASGGDYVNITKDLPVTVTDDGEVPVTVQFGATIYEVVEGETVTVAVTLSADPERTVVIPLTHTPQGSTTSADYSGVPANVTFSTGDMSQTIIFTATQDDVDDGGQSVVLGFGTNLPGGVSLGTTVTTTVSITDDDVAGVSVSEASLTIVEGSSGTYTIVLDSQPTADVAVTINDPSNTNVTAEPASLTFSSTDWSSPKTVTVNAAQDTDAEDETATVTHTVTSTDSIYSGALANSVAVSVTDDEVPVTVQFGATTYEVVEGETVTITVTLSADPERTVAIPITHTPQDSASSADYTVPTSVTFNAGQMSQTITFTAAQDEVDDDGERVLLGFGAPLPGGVSLGTTGTTTVSITDDDTPPTAANGTVTTDEDTAHTFAADEFGYADADGDALAHVKIIELPAAGTGALTLNGTAIPSADLPKTVTATELTENKLTYSPPANANGTGYASFKFKVNDGTEDSASEYFMTINVTAVNDPATGAPTISGTAHVGLTLTASTAGIDDVDGLPSAFTYQWKRVDADGTSNPTDIGADSSAYTLTAAEEGKKVLVEVSFTDDDGSSEGPLVSAAYPSTQSQTVNPNNRPTALDGTVTTVEDTDHTFAAANFSYSDTDSDPMASVKIIELPAAGTGALTLNGTAIPSADLPKTVTAAEVTENKLTYSPPANANGTGYASFKFKVNDGTEDSASEYFMTINVTAVNDPATGAPTISGTAHVGLTLTASTAGIDDVDGLPSAFTYQWKRVDADGTSNPTDIGADSSAYTLTAAEEGKKVLVEVSFTDNGGSSEGPLASAAYPSSGTVVNLTVSFGETTYEVVEGETVTVAVTLSADPERTVAIPITATPQDSASSADYTVPTSVTFNTGQMSQTITFTAAQDEVDDDGESVLLGFGTPLPGGVSLGTTVTTTVSITDDDGAGVSVSESSLTIAEGSSGTYTIVLNSQPTATVTVTINDPSNTDVTAEPASLTFSSTDWSSPKTVTVSAAQDADAEDETATVTHTVTSTDSIYSGASANSVAVMVTDDEVPVTVQFGATTYEVVEGETVTVVVTLSADPERTVVIPLTHSPQSGADSPADYTVPPSVTFNTGQMSQTITFTAAQDEVDDDGESVLLGFGAPLPGGVSLGTTGTTTVSITDDDGAGVSVSESSLTIAEGSSGTYTIVLDSQPTATVTVTINDPSNTDVTAEPASLTFSSTDWNTPKTVTVNAAQDADAEDETATVTHTVTSTDSIYSGASANSVAVSVTDDEVPVTVQFGATTYEMVEGETVTVAVTLSADPERTVAIPITATPQDSASSADYTVPTSVTFNTGQMSQTITFTAAQDEVDDDGESVLLGFGTPLPGGVSLGTTVTTTVSITDDDGAGVSVSESSLTIAEGSSGTYTIVLNSRPTATVTVTINDPSNTDVTAEPASLTFSSTDWSSPKTVTVNAAQDADAEDETATVTHTVTSTDSIYSGASANSVAVMVTDDEVPVTVQFGATTYEVVEGETVTVAVTLSADPERTVVIPITHTPQDGADSPADYTVPPSVTFIAGETEKTITFTATQDDVDDDGESVLLGFGMTLPPAVSLGTTTQATVSITDDDGAGVSVSESSLTIAEGSSGTYTIVLDSQPTATVTVTINDPSNTDVTAEPASLTFSSTDWTTPKTVTVSAAQDADAEDETATVTHTVTSTDSSYSAASANSVAVSVTDDEVPVTVQFGATTYEVVEGETVTVVVTLSADPERTVVIPITHTPQSGADSPADYTVPTSVTFIAGETEKTITFTATQDEVDDDGESVLLGFGTLPPAVSLGTTTQATVTITDDDGPQVTVMFGEATYTVAEGGTQSVTVALSADPERTVVIPLTHTPQGGATSADYSGVPANVTFNAEDTSKTFEFMATADDVDDDDESVLLGFGTPLPGGVTAGTTNQTTVTITGDCADGDIWCATATFDAQVDWEGRYDLHTGEVDNREFSYNGEDYQLWSLEMVQNGRNAGDDNHVVLPFGIPERTLFLIDFFNLNGTGNDRFEAPNDDWLDWTLHVSTVSDGETLTAALRFSEGRKLAGAWWRWSGGDIDDLRRAWKPGQLYKLRLVEDPRAQRTSQPLNPPLYLRVEGEVNTTQTWLRWLTPQTRYDRVPPVDSYNIQWKQSSGSWDAPADVSETTRGPSRQRAVSHFLDGLTPGVEYNIRVIATDSAGDSEPSNEITYTKPAAAQQSLSNTPAEGEPQINGIPEVGQTLSADTTAIADADGLDNAVFQYQWLASEADIPGATGATYTVVSGDVGKAIRVRVTFTDDAGHEETLTSAPTVVTAGLQLQSATVDGATLTLTYNEVLDTGVTLGTAPFAVSVNGSPRSLIAVGVGESNVLLLLSQAVEVGDTVTVDYTAPEGPDFIRDIRGRKAASFSGQAVTNDTASAQDNTASASDETASDPLTASAHDAPSSHNGQDAFTFELRFSEDPKSDFSYATVRDHAFTVTGGSVTYVRRLEPPSNIRWEITVTPGSGADVTIALNATTDCSAQGAICTEEGGKLSGGLLLVVPGPNAPATPNTPATDAPTISGMARVGETLTADTTGISDGDGLDNATFAYQWLAADAEIDGATAATYTLAGDDAGKAVKVRVFFTDDGGNDEELTSAATGAVAAAPPPANTPATGAPTITGAAEVGEPLTADATGISDDDGLDNATFAYQWLADDAEINGANASTYTLADDDAGKTIKVRVSFTDDAGNEEQLTSAMTGAVAAASPPPNTPATGAPTITGAAQVGETLTADTTGISDDDGLDNAIFSYQWLDDDEINGANASTYTLADADAGKAIRVRVSFADDAGNDEELTSASTGAVAAAVVNPPLTASAHDAPSSHNGQDAFTFELRFSEDPEPDFSYTTVRDHVFTVTGGSVTYVRRLEPGKNVRWEITVTPGSSADMTIALNATTDCSAQGAICTEDGRKLSGELELIVNGP